MPEPKPPTRFVYHASWIVTDPADGLGLEPIGPGRMSRVFGAVMAKLIDVDGDSQATVGAVSVTCQQEPRLDDLRTEAERYPPDAPLPLELQERIAERLRLAMIPLPEHCAAHGRPLEPEA